MKNNIHVFLIILATTAPAYALTPKTIVPKKEASAQQPIVTKTVSANMPAVEQLLRQLPSYTLKADKLGFDSYMLRLVTQLEPTTTEQRAQLKTTHAEPVTKAFKEIIILTDDKSILAKAKNNITKLATILGISIDTGKIPEPAASPAPQVATTPSPAPTTLQSPETPPAPVTPTPEAPLPPVTPEPSATPNPTGDNIAPAPTPATPEPVPTPTTVPTPEATPVVPDPTLMPPAA